jgi:hypothetical protein
MASAWKGATAGWARNAPTARMQVTRVAHAFFLSDVRTFKGRTVRSVLCVQNWSNVSGFPLRRKAETRNAFLLSRR